MPIVSIKDDKLWSAWTHERFPSCVADQNRAWRNPTKADLNLKYRHNYLI